MSNTDWRIKLFGDSILLNSTPEEFEQADVEQGVEEQARAEDTTKAVVLTESEPVDTFFKGYDYIAIFFGANYCPFCKKFVPNVLAAKPFLEAQKCKVIFVSNDRDLENFHISCGKVQGIDVMPYDTGKTAQMRDVFGLKTIPALMILHNADFQKDKPHVYSNAREILEQDPKCENFPWGSIEKNQAAPIGTWDRVWIRGQHGNWWQLGHKNVSEAHPNDMYMDEHAVRMRAGLLNVITWVAIMNIFHMQDLTLAKTIFGIVTWEFVSSMIFGLTPFAPLGWLGSLLACALHPAPLWKPAGPKRFAWLIGLCLALSCFTLIQFRVELGSAYKPAVAAVALTCNIATWLEGNAGFCVGCFIYNNVLVKYFDKEECSECKL